jgi:hypothetical protein
MPDKVASFSKPGILEKDTFYRHFSVDKARQWKDSNYRLTRGKDSLDAMLEPGAFWRTSLRIARGVFTSAPHGSEEGVDYADIILPNPGGPLFDPRNQAGALEESYFLSTPC